MRFFLASGLIALSLVGCTHVPNSPSLTLSTKKSPAEYAQCVLPKWQQEKPDTTMSEASSHYKIVAKSKVMADEILNIYKTSRGSEVSIYKRTPFPSLLGRGPLESAVHACL